MKLLSFATVTLTLLVLASLPSRAEETAQSPVVVKIVVAPAEVRDYRIDAVIAGKAPSPGSEELIDLDAAFRLKVRHRYSRREGDGLLPLEISLLDGQMTVQVEANGKKIPQDLQITPSIYPKLTVLLDRNWRIDEVFGLTTDRIAQSFPGISYGNHVILFFPQGLDQPRVPGDKWEWTLRIPTLGETYEVKAKLVGEQVIDGIRTAVVREEITRPTKENTQGIITSMKATAESTFAIDTGKLVKSHVDCEVTFRKKNDAQKAQPTSRANIKLDISLEKD
ncbi:MAG: hypothetical protein N3B12_00645 [Armatimonadetes bacterium]|nr:hypothetical protein [Armatimonadota bacterium]